MKHKVLRSRGKNEIFRKRQWQNILVSATEWGYDQAYVIKVYHLLATVTDLRSEHMIEQSIKLFSGNFI